jgi:hypothetical protein
MTKKPIQKENVANWFCKKHGLAGIVGNDWCFGCYKIDEDTETPMPYIGYEPKEVSDTGCQCRLCKVLELDATAPTKTSCKCNPDLRIYCEKHIEEMLLDNHTTTKKDKLTTKTSWEESK